jgi:hypothetical protein
MRWQMCYADRSTCAVEAASIGFASAKWNITAGADDASIVLALSEARRKRQRGAPFRGDVVRQAARKRLKTQNVGRAGAKYLLFPTHNCISTMERCQGLKR